MILRPRRARAAKCPPLPVKRRKITKREFAVKATSTVEKHMMG